ncbi:MAG: tyrosine-type recombinase/integrase, partial [Solirubrobacteraceae bacterium]
MILKRGRSYGVSVYDPRGQQKKWVGSYPTLREARAAARAAAARPARGGTIDAGAFAARWVDDYPRAAAATQKTHGYAVKRFIADFTGTSLDSIERPTARAWALKVPNNTARIVRAMFTDAINDGFHPGPNPFANLRLEQPRGRKDLTALTEPEVLKLADCALAAHGTFGASFRAMILFAAYVGVRPGELYALERGDIRADEVVIRQSLDGTGQIKRPKNGKERVVVLPPLARDALRDVPGWPDVPWLFCTPRGRRFDKGKHSYYWRPVRTLFGRPTMDFYEL